MSLFSVAPLAAARACPPPKSSPKQRQYVASITHLLLPPYSRTHSPSLSAAACRSAEPTLGIPPARVGQPSQPSLAEKGELSDRTVILATEACLPN